MGTKEKKLEDQLHEVGSRLASPPSTVEELLPLLEKTERLLYRVEQSPSDSISSALKPIMGAFEGKSLLEHSDLDVKVAVASCFSEIARITAPENPYNDDIMEEMLKRIVQTFENLDDMSSRSFSKRVSILETVAKVRLCVVMLDLDCDAMILEMFHHFLKTIRPNHSEKIFSSMETIMTLVLDESEDISSELISCLLDSVKSDQDVLAIVRALGEKVISNCAGKLKPSIVEFFRSTGTTLNEYGKVVASIFQANPGGVEQNYVIAPGEITELDCREEVGTNEKLSKSGINNGTVKMGNGELRGELSSQKQKPEPSYPGKQPKKVTAANRDVSDVGAVKISLPTEKEFLDTTRPKRGRSSSKLIAPRQRNEADRSASPLQNRSSEPQDQGFSPKDLDGINSSHRKSSSSKADHGDHVQKSRISRIKESSHLTEKKSAGEPLLKEMISSLKARKRKRKVDQATEKVSETSTENKDLGSDLVGSRIRVWWPIDKEFYEGVIDSYDQVSRKHKIVYRDGDEEVLLLEKERWEFVKDGRKMEMEKSKDTSADASEGSKRRKRRTSSGSIIKNSNTPLKSGTTSNKRRRGRQPKVGVSTSDNIVDSSDKPEETSNKSKVNNVKSSTKLKKDDANSSPGSIPSKSGSVKTGRKPTDGTPKSASELEDNAAGSSGRSRKRGFKLKLDKDGVKVGKKMRGTASPKVGSGSTTKLQTKTTPRASKSEASSTGKKRKRKGQP